LLTLFEFQGNILLRKSASLVFKETFCFAKALRLFSEKHFAKAKALRLFWIPVFTGMTEK
jgi:hypothetical protein